MDKHAEYHYSNGAEKRTKEQLRDEYEKFWLRTIMRDIPIACRPHSPERAVREGLANMEKNDPAGFLDDFKRWADIEGWQRCAGYITESGAGTRVADGVNS